MHRHPSLRGCLLLALLLVASARPAPGVTGAPRNTDNATASTSASDDATGARPLENLVLSCCTVIRYPNVVESPNRPPYGLEGLALLSLKELEGRLGFRCSSIERFKGAGTGFTALINRMDACSNGSKPLNSSECHCQLGVGAWTKTASRAGRVRFLPEFLRTEFAVLSPVEATTAMSSTDFFLGAFTAPVWILIFVLFVLFTFLRMMDKRFEPPPADFEPLEGVGWFHRTRHYLLKSKLLYRLRKAAMRTMFELLGAASAEAGASDSSSGVGPTTSRAIENKPDTFRQRLITLLITLCGLFFVLSYEATMTARLVQESHVSRYQSVEDFKNCVVPSEEVCLPKGGAVESLWRNSFLRERCSDGRMPRLIGSHTESIEMVANNTCKFLLTTGVTAGIATTRKYCDNVMRVGAPVMKHGLGMIMPFHVEERVFREMEKATFDLLENGSLMDLDAFFAAQGGCTVQPEGTITFSKTRVFFYAAFASIVIMFFAMLLDPPLVHARDNCTSQSTGSRDQDHQDQLDH